MCLTTTSIRRDFHSVNRNAWGVPGMKTRHSRIEPDGRSAGNTRNSDITELIPGLKPSSTDAQKADSAGAKSSWHIPGNPEKVLTCARESHPPPPARRPFESPSTGDGSWPRTTLGPATASSRTTSTATWRVDGRTVYRAPGALIPERVRLGIGIWTMLPIRGDRSRSLEGQGIDVRWGRFRVLSGG